MKNFFKMEGKFFNILSKISDLLWLNVLTIVCSVPIITAGASITAMYSVTLSMVKKEEGYLTRDFFKAFASNFLQATAMWAVLLGGASVILADVHIIGNYAPQFQTWLLIPMCFIVIVLLALYLYAFPLQAYFKNTIRGTLGNALKLSLAHLPYTIVFLILQAMPVIVIYYVTNIGFLVALGWGFAGIGYLCSFAYHGIFHKYEEQEETDVSDSQTE